MGLSVVMATLQETQNRDPWVPEAYRVARATPKPLRDRGIRPRRTSSGRSYQRKDLRPPRILRSCHFWSHTIRNRASNRINPLLIGVRCGTHDCTISRRAAIVEIANLRASTTSLPQPIEG